MCVGKKKEGTAYLYCTKIHSIGHISLLYMSRIKIIQNFPKQYERDLKGKGSLRVVATSYDETFSLASHTSYDFFLPNMRFATLFNHVLLILAGVFPNI